MALLHPGRAPGWCPIPPRRIDWRSRVEITSTLRKHAGHNAQAYRSIKEMKELPLDQNNNNINGLNQALVDELKRMGCIQTPRVEAAFQAVLRHQFLPETP